MINTNANPKFPDTPDEDFIDMELSIVMPCLNESKTIGCCIIKAHTALTLLGIRGEIVVADNGSTDGSREIALRAGARVVVVEDLGYGAAIQGGVKNASGNFIVMGDADDSYDFLSIGPFIERLRKGDDLVMGNRFKGQILPGSMPWHHRYIGNPLLTGVLNLFFHSPIGDAHCGMRAFRKDTFHNLRLISSGMEFASEMVIKACLMGAKISEIPITLHPDGRDRPPHLRSFSDGWRHLRLLLLLCPTWVFLFPAAFLMSIGIFLVIWLTPGERRTGQVTLDVHTMTLGVMCTLLGFQMFCLWCHAKVTGLIQGLLPSDISVQTIFRFFTLERGIIFGLFLFAIGLLCDIQVALEWYAKGLGALEVRTTLRYALWGLMALVLSAQIISSSFLLSLQLIGVKRNVNRFDKDIYI